MASTAAAASGAACARPEAPASAPTQPQDAQQGAARSSGGGARSGGRKRRKSTNTLRREEKEQLERQERLLRARLKLLAGRGAASRDEDEAARNRRCSAQLWQNRRARRLLVDRQLQFAPVHALLGEYAALEAQTGNPIHRFLHLTTDAEQRQRALVDAKTQILAKATAFLDQRRPKWSAWRPLREERSFEAPNGDAYFVSFSILQFERIRSVPSAFESVKRFFSDLEIRISDQLAYITVREDDDYVGAEIPQNRLVSTTQTGYHIESNSVFFSEFEPASSRIGGERGYGRVVTDFVDIDDLYPYRPSTRIRRDLSSILEVTSFERDNPVSGEIEVTVVLTRWVCLKTNYPEFKVDPTAWSELREIADHYIKLLNPSTIENVL